MRILLNESAECIIIQLLAADIFLLTCCLVLSKVEKTTTCIGLHYQCRLQDMKYTEHEQSCKFALNFLTVKFC